MTSVVSNVVKGMGTFSLKSLNPASNGDIIVLPNSTAFTFNPNIEVSEVRTNTVTGVSVLARLIETSANPEITLTLPMTPQAIAMAFNAEWETANAETVTVIKTVLPTATTIAAATSGNLGYGVAADAVSKAGYIDPADPTTSVQLTQVTYATFDPAITNDSFAIGANGAIKISANVVALSPLVTFQMPNSLNVRQFGESTFDTFEVRANLIMVDLSIINVVFPSLQVKPDSRNFDPASGSVELTLTALNDGSSCNYNPQVRWLGQSQLVNC